MKYAKVKRDDDVLIYNLDEVAEGFNFYIAKTGLFYGKSNISYLGEIDEQADNPEELVDKFVLNGIDIIFLNKERTQYRFEGTDEWTNITDTELRIGIYGAIWTKYGLTYIAKMNKERSFELL